MALVIKGSAISGIRPNLPIFVFPMLSRPVKSFQSAPIFLIYFSEPIVYL